MINWRHIPEVRLLVLGLPLQVLWETAQLPLYTVWYQKGWGYILYSIVHCTLGDLLILLISYELIALLNRNRYWIDKGVLWNGLVFTVFGAGYTIYSEVTNVYIEKTWAYTDVMPIVPIVGIGLAPLLQWLIIPPLLLWLTRLTGQQARKSQ